MTHIYFLINGNHILIGIYVTLNAKNKQPNFDEINKKKLKDFPPELKKEKKSFIVPIKHNLIPNTINFNHVHLQQSKAH